MDFRRLLFCAWIALLFSGFSEDCSSAEIVFRRHLINADSRFSACAAIDVNRDGRLDIFSGGFWYEAPDWQRRRTRNVPEIRGRFDDYSNLPFDVNRDGWVDIISVNYRSKSLYWVENPGSHPGEWKTHLIDTPGPSETGRLVDIDHDGILDVLPNGTKYAAWYQLDPAGLSINGKLNPNWLRHDLPFELAGHGVGFGDIDGDGRTDLVGPQGWLRAPEDPITGRWIWQPEFSTHRDASVPILVHDVDRDGDADLIWGRGHNIGLYWMEQLRVGDQRRWQLHAIDTSWSGAHAIMLADIDGDQRQDLVAGKRYLGHGGKDPGEYDPLAVYWYSFAQGSKSWTRHSISVGGTCGFDLDPKCVDMDGDGDVDILAPTRAGLHYLENLGHENLGHENLGHQTADLLALAEDRSISKGAKGESLLSLQNHQGESQTVKSELDWGLKRWQILRVLEQVMGPLPGPSRRVPLKIERISEEETTKYIRRKILFSAEAGDRVPAYLLIPKSVRDSPGNKLPAMLCLHPTSPLGKAQVCGLGGKPSRFYAHELAEQGFVCLAPDYPSFGDYQDYDFERDQYVSGTMKAIWNNIRGVDLLESLPFVDRDKIGCIGHSLGGHNSLFTAAFDQRIRAVVTSCGFNSFKHYYGGDLKGWTSARYMPLIQTRYGLDPAQVPFDFDSVLAVISPRPVFVNAPLHDANFAVEGVRLSLAGAQEVFKLHDAFDQVTVVFPNVGHEFPSEIRQQAYEWLKQKLDP
ncbi:MAG: alpha/beta fold hydrolase [Pirellulaceae bacterium]|nr:alpha/beta fold hydrolase [Pirellulaceae bacterium]